MVGCCPMRIGPKQKRLKGRSNPLLSLQSALGEMQSRGEEDGLARRARLPSALQVLTMYDHLLPH